MLRIQNLSKTYPSGTQALKNVSFDVNDGEFMVVIGLSGSGKSTLLRCINRLIDPTEGKILWDDVDITAAPPAELRQIRRKIGMVFQQFQPGKTFQRDDQRAFRTPGICEPVDEPRRSLVCG